MRRLLASLGLALVALQGASCPAAAQTLTSPVLKGIKDAGVIRVGVKNDVAPFGSVSAAGEVVGFEIDLAEDIAQRLGVRLVKVPVSTEARFQKLELGEVDMLLATVADSLERRKIATAIEPGYFEAGVTVMLPPNQRLKDWNAVRGKNLCALQGAYFNRPTSERYLLNLQSYKSVRDALLAVDGGRCDGFLYNGPAIRAMLKKPEFKDYSAPFPEALVSPWTVFIRKSEQGGSFEQFLGDVSASWYRDGTLTALAVKWGVRSSSWPADQLALWTRRSAGGSYFCTRNDKGMWPPDCRRAEFVKADDASGLRALGLTLKENTGIDLSYVYDTYDRQQFARGLMYTLMLTALSILATLVLGALAAIVAQAQLPVLSRLTFAVLSAGRIIPPLLMMYLLFFGFGGVLLSRYQVRLPELLVAVFSLGFYSAGIVMSALHDAAAHLRKQRPVFRLSLRTLPDVMEYARWPIRQALINVTKMSMIASAIAIPELLSQFNLIMAERGNLVVMMITLVLVYYLITNFWIWAITLIESRLYPARPQAT